MLLAPGGAKDEALSCRPMRQTRNVFIMNEARFRIVDGKYFEITSPSRVSASRMCPGRSRCLARTGTSGSPVAQVEMIKS